MYKLYTHETTDDLEVHNGLEMYEDDHTWACTMDHIDITLSP